MQESALFCLNAQIVVSFATAIQILSHNVIPPWVCVCMSILDALLFILVHYRGAKKMEFVFLTMISLMTLMFMSNMIVSNPEYRDLAIGGIVPNIPAGSIPSCLGLVGAVIQPSNMHLLSALVIVRKINYRNRNEINEGNIYNKIECALSLFISFCVNTSVIATFGTYSLRNPGTKGLTLYTAAAALESNFGPAARYIWAVGLLASGQSTTMTSSYAGQYSSEGFLEGKTIPLWMRVIIVRTLAIIPTIYISFLGNDAFVTYSTWLNVFQSF